MRIRSIAVIVDVSPGKPAKNGKSNLACVQETLITSFSMLEQDDRVFFYSDKGIKLCETSGECNGAISSYQGHKLKFNKAIAECMDILEKSEENDDLYLLGITDKYDKKLSFSCNVHLKRELAKPFHFCLWSIGVADDNVYKLDDATDLTVDKVISEIFLEEMVQCHQDIENDCFPLSV